MNEDSFTAMNGTCENQAEDVAESGSVSPIPSEEKYKLIFETLESSMVVVDKNGVIIDINPYHVNSVGRGNTTSKDYLGRNVLKHPSVVNAGLVELYQQVLEGEKIDKKNVYFPSTTGGTEEYFNVRGAPLLIEGKVHGAVFVHDKVTENMRMLESLRQYAQIVSHSSDMMALIDKKYIYKAANIVYLQRFKLTSEQLLGHSVTEVLGQDFFHSMVKANADRCLSGEEINYQKWFDFPGSGRLFMDVRYYPYIDSENKIQGFVFNGRNITEQKKMIDEIRFSEQHLKLYREQSPLAAIEWNTEGLIIAWNIAAEKMFGYRLEEVKNRSIDFLFPSRHRHDVAQNWRSLMMQEDGQPLIRENLIKVGLVIICQWHNSLIRGKDGEIIGATSLVSDITSMENAKQDLQNKEYEQQEILNNLIDGVITIDEQGEILSFNRVAEELFGYSSKEVIGKNIRLLMPEPQAQQHDSYIQNYLRTGKAKIIGIGREVTALRKNNETFPIRLAISEIPRKAKGKRCFVGSFHDLTDQKQQAEQLHRSQKIDALGKLTGGIAHDYNNMLGVILGYTEILQTKLSDNLDVSHYLENIREAGLRSKNMTEKLLSFSRKKACNPQPTNLNHVIKNDQEMLAKSLTARIDLKLKLCNSPWPIKVDRSELQDVLLNLSINAQHAMPEGGILSFSTFPQTFSNDESKKHGLAAGDYMCLSITDNGTGIDESIKAKIFDPFFSTKGDRGTGLGLSQVFGFVQRSGGAINVTSRLGLGSRFDLYFPRDNSEKIKITSDKMPDKQDYSGHETLLVVDDEPLLREVIAETLITHGYQVLLAKSGEQALKILAQHNEIVLMLSDVIMPKMDGFLLATKVGKIYPHIKIQMLSGYTDGRHSVITDNELHENMLYKPINNQEILKRIRYLLDKEKPGTAPVQRNVLADEQALQAVEWNEKFSTGVVEIDDDHKILVALANRCSALFDSQEQGKEIGAILYELQDYTAHHFQREECIMKVCEYPNLEKHKQVHHMLNQEIHNLFKKHNLGQLDALSLLNFFSTWLNEHVTYMDKAIIPYCQGNQAKIKQALKNMEGINSNSGGNLV